MFKMKTILLTICFLICSLYPNMLAVADEPENLYSVGCALMDGETGRVLFGKEETKPLANASTTKILTCIIALEEGKVEEYVMASDKASTQPKVHLGMKSGQEFLLLDMLYSIMLESFNDCAVVVAEAVSGSCEEFAKRMNEKAKQIGCEDTYFITPNGLDENDGVNMHHSTASDLCKIMRYCVWESPKNEDFLKITQTRNHTFYDKEGEMYQLSNKNSFLSQMEGVLSGKTGYTSQAGYCYVAALEIDGKKLCLALLGCGWPNNKGYKWKDARTLFEYGLEEFHLQSVYCKELEYNWYFPYGKGELQDLSQWGEGYTLKGYVKPEDFSKYLLREGEELRYEVRYNLESKLPIKKDEKIGSVQIYLEADKLEEITVFSSENIEEWTLFKVMEEVFKNYFK